MAKLFGKRGYLRRVSRPLRRKAKGRVLAALAGLKRRFLRAKFIAVTGSSGKSTTTLLIARLLASQHRTKMLVYTNTFLNNAKRILHTRRDDDYVVMEIGAGGDNDVAKSARLIRPDVAVVTFVGLEHKSKFKTEEGVAQAKGALVEAVAADGFAVLNADDPRVMAMAERTRARIVTIGRENEADYRVTGVSQRFPGPLDVTIVSRHGTHRLSTGLVGVHYWVTVAAGFAVAMELGVDPANIETVLAGFTPAVNRCEPLHVENGPTFILDTFKAPAGTLSAAFDVLRAAEAPRKRIVLGMLSDYRGDSRKAYGRAYAKAAEVADQVIMIGEHAHRHRAPRADIEAGRVIEMPSLERLLAYLRETAVPGELILLKSSGNFHLERVALAFARDVACWKERCGVGEPCQICGLYPYPFEEHGGIDKRGLRRGAPFRYDYGGGAEPA